MVVAVIGLVLTTISLFVALYYERSPNLAVEIIGESDVLDVRRPVEELTILFRGEDIQEGNQNLRVLTVRFSNTGRADILQTHYDRELPWGLLLQNGRIIRGPTLVDASSSYLIANLHPRTAGDTAIVFNKIILEEDQFFTIELLLLHEKQATPQLVYTGKIAGISNVVIERIKPELRNQPATERWFRSGSWFVRISKLVLTLGGVLVLFVIGALALEQLFKPVWAAVRRRRQRKVSGFEKAHANDGPVYSAVVALYVEHGKAPLEPFRTGDGNRDLLLFTLQILKLQDTGTRIPMPKHVTDRINVPLVKEIVAEGFATLENGELRIEKEFETAISELVSYLEAN